MNDVCIRTHLRYFATLISILLTSTVSLTTATTIRPIYPCQYKDSNQRIYKCDICTCISSPPLFSTSNLCSLLSSTLTCSDNVTKENRNEELLRLRLDEFESETDHQSMTHNSLIPKRTFNNIEFEFDNFHNDIIKNILQFDQLCSSMNNSRITFYRLQTNQQINDILQCQLTLSSLRFLDSTIENNYFTLQTNPDTVIYFNCTFNIQNFNVSSLTTILSFSYTRFNMKPFVLNSLVYLTHLTLTHTTNFDIIGSYSNLIYLDLCFTELDNMQLNKLFSQVDMPDLTTLILSNNYLTVLQTKFPSTIRYLDLSNNQIKSLDYTSFKSLYSLNTLNLSFNSPLDIQQDTFTRIPYLEVLDLTSSLPSLPFVDLFVPLQKLRYLNISSNNLISFPYFPVPHDAHTIVSYDHHLPVLYVDMSNNNLNRIDFDVLSSASTQDKYIISIDMSNNRLKTLEFPSNISKGIKRRGPLVELNINNNPLECDCNLHENIYQLIKNDITAQQQQTSIQQFPPVQPSSQPFPSGFYSNQYPSSGNYVPQQVSLPHPYSQPINSLNYVRKRRQFNSINKPSPLSLLAQNLVKHARIKLLHLSNLTCKDMIQEKLNRSLFDLNSSNSFCSYIDSCPSTCTCCPSSSSSMLNINHNCNCYYRCPSECSCKHSHDLTKNYVNCSDRYLYKIPSNIPYTTTHLYLNNNQIKSIENNLTYLIKLEYLSLGNNQLEALSNDDFLTLTKLEHLDVSSNRIKTISPKTFSTLFILKDLYLHNNPWLPKFYNGKEEFQYNIRLTSLTYGKGLSCNRSATSLSINLEKPLTAEDCCKDRTIESCKQTITSNDDNTVEGNSVNDKNKLNSKRFLQFLLNPKYRLYVLIGLTIVILILICLIVLCCIFCVCRKKKSEKQPSPAERKLLANGDSRKSTNHYHKPLQGTSSSTQPQLSLTASATAIQKLINSTREKTSTTAYTHQENDVSMSYSDNDDDYASIPLTVSQVDLSQVIRPQPPVPPLPPPRLAQQQQQQRLIVNRPVSHTSTTSTSTTIRSIVPILKRSNSSTSKQAQSLLTPARSCLQIKLDALVLYSINDSELVHGNIGETLENVYGKRFSFYFVHRDRMLGELDSLIENSCVTIIILRKPYHIVHDYMKILSTSPSIKIFLILVNDEKHHHSSSLKAREKIAKLYHTTNIYEWNPDPTSIIHKQLELFLEQNCGSATYVPY